MKTGYKHLMQKRVHLKIERQKAFDNCATAGQSCGARTDGSLHELGVAPLS
jgi:hypothetical protein